MNVYFILTLASSVLSPFLYEWISKSFKLAKFIDGLIMAVLLGLVSLHILPESFEHAGVGTFFAFTLGLLGPTFISKIFKKNECEIQKPFLLISVLGFIAHNMLDGAALIVHPHSHKSTHLLALAIVMHRLLENMALWRTLSKNLNLILSILCVFGLSLSMCVGYFAGEAIFLRLDADIFHILQALACGLLFHVIMHPHHVKEIFIVKTQGVGAFCGLVLAILAYLFWPAHLHSTLTEHENGYTHEHKH